MKNIRGYIVAFIFGALIFSIGAVFAYSYYAQNVGFTPTDTGWEVDNTKDALDDLYDQTNEYNHLKSFGMLFNLKFNTYVDDVKVMDPYSIFDRLYLLRWNCEGTTQIAFENYTLKANNVTDSDICNLYYSSKLIFSNTKVNLNVSNRKNYVADGSEGANVPGNALDGSMAAGNGSNWYSGTKLLVEYKSVSKITEIGVYTTDNWGYSFSPATIYYSDDDTLTLSSNLSNYSSVTVNTGSDIVLSEAIIAKRVMLVKESRHAVYEFKCNGYAS